MFTKSMWPLDAAQCRGCHRLQKVRNPQLQNEELLTRHLLHEHLPGVEAAIPQCRTAHFLKPSEAKSIACKLFAYCD
jgi:hypothetical protein